MGDPPRDDDFQGSGAQQPSSRSGYRRPAGQGNAGQRRNDQAAGFEDQYETALVDLINQKRAGKPITPKDRPRGENVVDLMEALRRSVGGAATESKAAGK